MTATPSLPSRTFSSKPDFDECIARIYAWLDQEIIDRPPVRFYHHNVEYDRPPEDLKGWNSYEERWMDVDHQIQEWENTVATTEFLGETFPVYWPNLSAVAYNLFLGQPGEFDDLTAWLPPIVSDLNDLPPLKVDRGNKYFKAVEDMTLRALERAEGRYMVGLTDLYAGIDCTLGLRGAERLCMDLYDNPAGVHALIDAAFADYYELYEYYDNRLKEHDQLAVNWMNVPSFDQFNVLAADFSVNISQDHFDEFVMPVVRKEAALFSLNAFHTDGPGVAKHIDSILTNENMPIVQWAQGMGRDLPIMQWIPLVEKVQAAGKSIIVDVQPHELDEFMSKVDPTGILIWIAAEPEDQRDVLKKLEAW